MGYLVPFGEQNPISSIRFDARDKSHRLFPKYNKRVNSDIIVFRRYASGATVQIILFATLAIELKRKVVIYYYYGVAIKLGACKS